MSRSSTWTVDPGQTLSTLAQYSIFAEKEDIDCDATRTNPQMWLH
jgi:hypothetical protein